MKPEIELQTTKDDLLNRGYTPLSKKELLELISDNTVCGDYEYNGHRIYKSFMNSNGEVEGKNDWGSTESGRWSVDENGYLSVEWDGYWEAWSGVAFKVDDEVKFYNLQDGTWQTTFHKILEGEHDLDVS